MRLDDARQLADGLRERLLPYCVSATVAGSIRRRKPEVGDVEIVAVPRWEAGGARDLFGEAERLNRLHDWALEAERRGEVTWIKPGVSEVIPWEPRPEGKYWRGLLPGGMKLDLFLAEPENLGLILLVRTGCAEFSEAVVTHAKRIGKPSSAGHLRGPAGEAIPTPGERDVFRLLGLEWVEPDQRMGRAALRACR